MLVAGRRASCAVQQSCGATRQSLQGGDGGDGDRPTPFLSLRGVEVPEAGITIPAKGVACNVLK